jgi:hypothetical protein
MYCSEHLESVHVGAKVGALGINKTCAQLFEGIMEFVLRYLRDGEGKLQGYTESTWTCNVTDMKSTLGCCFSFGSPVISWFMNVTQIHGQLAIVGEKIAYKELVSKALNGFVEFS